MSEDKVARHYTHGALLAAIEAGLGRLGKSPDGVTVEDLAPVDEFHIGGREASLAFLGQLQLEASMHVLDVGCGLGGAARFTAAQFGSRVTGIDLTREFVETGRDLCAWVGLGERISLTCGSALDMPFDAATFDAAYMMHVGMNIPDKEALFADVARVLKPGAVFGVYDVMQTNPGELTYPVPWAETPATSALASPEHYKAALEAAGFTVTAERSRRQFAIDFFSRMREKFDSAGGPPPLGTHLLMGETAPVKAANMSHNISAGLIAPVELIARKPH